MKGQAGVVAGFLILIGLLIYVYWLVLPMEEKEKLLKEIIEEEKNVTVKEETHKILIKDVELYKDGYSIIVAYNYTVGRLVRLKEVNFGSFLIKSSYFNVGKVKISFPFEEKYEGIEISFKSDCKDCKIRVILNGEEIYFGPADNFSKMIPKDYLLSKNELIIYLEPEFLKEKTMRIYNLKIYYLGRSYIKKKVKKGNAILEYNFCPEDPVSLEVYINGKRLYLTSCYGQEELSLEDGYIEIYSNKEVNIKEMKLTYKDKKFSFIVPKPSDNLIFLTVLEGEGILKFNDCKFKITPETNVIKIPEYCIMNENIVEISTKSYLKIEKIYIK